MALFGIAFGFAAWGVTIWVRQRFPKLLRSNEKARETAEEIYDKARNRGGKLVATSIKPHSMLPKDDFAKKYLKRVERDLEYERVIVTDNQDALYNVLENMSEQLDARVTAVAFTPKTIPVLPPLVWSVIPRLNMLLYRDEKGKYDCLIGLDTVENGKRDNFAIRLRNKWAFELLSHYFRKLKEYHRGIDGVRDFKEYQRSKNRSMYDFTSSTRNALLRWAEDDDDVLHVGLFGTSGAQTIGVATAELRKTYDADLDVMVIVKNETASGVKRRIRNLLEGLRLSIVWGDDTEYFYNFRPEDSRTVDVEIKEEGTHYYQRHSLLGYSNFAHYARIYPEYGPNVSDLIKLPPVCHSARERWEVCITNRKGIKEFKTRTSQGSHLSDPRRLLSILIRNVAWALTGARFASTYVALDALDSDWQHIFHSVQRTSVEELLQASTDDIRKVYENATDVLKHLSDGAVNFAAQRYPDMNLG